MGVFFYIPCGPNSSPDSQSLLYHMYFYYTQERSLQARATSVTQLSFRKNHSILITLLLCSWLTILVLARMQIFCIRLLILSFFWGGGLFLPPKILVTCIIPLLSLTWLLVFSLSRLISFPTLNHFLMINISHPTILSPTKGLYFKSFRNARTSPYIVPILSFFHCMIKLYCYLSFSCLFLHFFSFSFLIFTFIKSLMKITELVNFSMFLRNCWEHFQAYEHNFSNISVT